MTAAIDILLGLVLLGVSLYLLVGPALDARRHRRALQARRLEDIGILIAVDSPDTDSFRRYRYGAKKRGTWFWKVGA